MKHYTGWLLPDGEREKLLAMYPPEYPDVIAHHITDAFGVAADYPVPEATCATIVGIAQGRGVQALVAEIDGSTERADGSTYHITWSIDKAAGAKPVDSNALIASRGFDPLPRTVIRVVPKLF